MKTFEIGEPLRSLDEIAEQEFIYFRNYKVYHCGWFMSWPARQLLLLAKDGAIRKAIKKQAEKKED